MSTEREVTLIVKQNLLKNATVLMLSIVLTFWIYPYVSAIGTSGTDAFLFLSIFPLGAMFGYFAFRYADTNLQAFEHRVLADAATFIFLLVICFSIAFATLIGIVSIPQLTAPFVVLSLLLVLGCLLYDFWNLYCNLRR